MRKPTFVPALAIVLCALSVSPRTGADAQPLSADSFDTLHKMIRVQAEEQRFWRIPWKLSIAEARKTAAKEGKPILIWGGAGGAPIGVC